VNGRQWRRTLKASKSMGRKKGEIRKAQTVFPVAQIKRREGIM